MKKYGKYERRPEQGVEKQPEVKSGLLQTYFTSLLCLVLSVTMFFGTSFAWFTSEVNNVGNEIYIGTLDVELEKKTGDTTWASLSALTTEGVNTTRLFDGQVRWEPGYTMLETVRVTNEGDLAFKYELNFTDGSLSEVTGSTMTLQDVAQFFDVWVYDHAEGAPVPDPQSYAQINEENGWKYAGSLKDLLAGNAVLTGTMEDVRYETVPTDPTVVNQNTTDGKASVKIHTIALHMNEKADATVMGRKISLNVKLVAYQMASEEDALGGEYDEIISVASAEDFVNALTASEGGNVLMLNDIEIPADTPRIDITGKVNLDMNGKTLTLHREGTSILVESTGALIISGNGTMEKTSHGGNMIFVYGDLTIMDGVYGYTPYNFGYGSGDNYCGATSKYDCHCVDKNDHHCDSVQHLGTIITAHRTQNDSTKAAEVKIYGGYFNTGILNANTVDQLMFAMFNCAEGDAVDGAITIYGGQFVDVNPVVGDANGAWVFLKGQTEKGQEAVPGYEISPETIDVHTIYTVKYDPSKVNATS